ncbi:Glycosyl transferase 4-like domain-containing protein [Robiginitalea myxolifaciens]|uniref:Glycosyl transferase 4-like domain-containing protein n=1 Tax=Robiginitalea myxolifaciens TaxID=400055 RepID=A0A1I6GVB5_9FLAO|nr:glycosyltransferase [Robiginitalea myxolifaciens]SFR46007.1 Glycosyl transferase 4-like domain-containing protein [Robiginitalea myxolifaciens]
MKRNTDKEADTERSNKVLIITYYWPPAGGPGVQRWLYFTKYLQELGVSPVLYIPARPNYPLQDKGLGQEAPENLKIYRATFWEPYRLASLFGKKRTQRISAGIIKRERPGFLERLLLWIRGNLFIPDARKFWVSKALKEVPGILEGEGIDTVITTGPPHSLHLIGKALKSRHGIRWLADFRDPWTTIGYQDTLQLGRRARRLHTKLELAVLQAADVVIATSGHTAADFEAISQRPIHVITNGYAGDLGSGKQPKGFFTLAHIGSLLSGRNPEVLWEVLAELCSEIPGFEEELRLELTGIVSPEVKASISQAGLDPYVVYKQYLPHAEALEAQRQAQILLLLEINSAKTKGIVPGKLFEYMAAARPILAIGPEQWEAANLLNQAGCGKGFTYRQTAEIREQIVHWYQAYSRGELHQDPSGAEQFHRKKLTRDLKSLLWE